MTVLWMRVNTLLLVLVLLALLAGLGLLASGARGGPLDPAGPPASTNSVKLPGTPLSQPASFPIVISEPGSYYLTSNITGAGFPNNVINVTTSNVSLDLMGFTVSGPADHVISEVGTHSNITIRNGTVGGGFNAGIAFQSSSRVVIEDVTVSGNVQVGISVGPRALIHDCVVEAPPASGFIDQAAIIAQDGSSVSNCTTSGYQTGIAVGAGSRVSDVVVSGARKTGIFAGKSVVENSMVSHMQGMIAEPTFGILLGTGGRVTGNTVKHIRGDVEAIGIYIADSAADPANTMASVSHNVISRVSAAGQAPAVCIVVQSAFTAIHDNDCLVSGVGISVQSQETTVYRNHIAGATTPIMDFTGGNDIAVLSSAVAATSPLANIVN